jgi:predicted kinase
MLSQLMQFEKFRAEFKLSKLWQNMEATVENSHWHREANVAVHTEMILAHYNMNFAEHRTPRQRALTWLAILFHDTGKPAAKKDKHTEERGHYQSFGGHEQLSARLWEDYAVENWNKWKQLKASFDLKDTDIYLISWVIENHLPHNLDSDRSIKNIATQLHSEIFEFGELAQVYYDQIISDQAGRISDNHEKNMAEVQFFVERIQTTTHDPRVDSFIIQERRFSMMPKLVLMVGASGSGKSTYCSVLESQGFKYFSLDASRIRYGQENGTKGSNPIDVYARAFAYCDKHRGPFRQYADREFSDLVKAGENIIIDNTNVNQKARENYSTYARENGYQIGCAMFPITKAKLLERQKARRDKTVPIVAVLDQYKRISMPWLGSECDEIFMSMGNVDGEKS